MPVGVSPWGRRVRRRRVAPSVAHEHPPLPGDDSVRSPLHNPQFFARVLPPVTLQTFLVGERHRAHVARVRRFTRARPHKARLDEVLRERHAAGTDRPSLPVNRLSHASHPNGLCVCPGAWPDRLPNAMHTPLHRYGRSSPCVHRRMASVLFWAKIVPHASHRYGFRTDYIQGAWHYSTPLLSPWVTLVSPPPPPPPSPIKSSQLCLCKIDDKLSIYLSLFTLVFCTEMRRVPNIWFLYPVCCFLKFN